uniref:Uncharacterized protein n=1 Tax=Trypanosoma congolense (strain IL3000) TaxID=1068625 RepID=G0URL4_TRYCI|nr:hypothetical protein, unlikely [Trypanosoma congolense IL3000]
MLFPLLLCWERCRVCGHRVAYTALCMYPGFFSQPLLRKEKRARMSTSLFLPRCSWFAYFKHFLNYINKHFGFHLLAPNKEAEKLANKDIKKNRVRVTSVILKIIVSVGRNNTNQGAQFSHTYLRKGG